MATVTAVLRKSKKKIDNTIPIAVRISEGIKNKYISLGHAVLEKDWDEDMQKVKRSNPNFDYINSLILKRRTEVDKLVLEVRLYAETDILDSIQRRHQKKERDGFFVMAEEYLKGLYLNKKFTRLSAEKPRVKHFKEFLSNRDIQFKKIDVALLKNFSAYLKNKQKCGERTVMNHMVVIRTIYNLAIKEKIASLHDYPFGKHGFRIKYPESIKIGLNEDEVHQLEYADLSHLSELDHVRNVWLFSFYLAGMRISDVLRLKWNDFSDHRLNYKMGKNKKVVSLKLPDKAAAILEKYKAEESLNNGFVFPDMRNADYEDEENMYRNIVRVTGKFDKLLKELAKEIKITKPLTNHISRHTFGNITGDKISPQMLQKLYRHSHISTTMGYQANFIHKDVDDALEAVLDF